MISFRPIDLDKDYPTLERWWKGHNAVPWPKVVLPRGLMAIASGVEVAASFLYLTPDKVAVIELTTVNPQCALSHDSLICVKGLFMALEEEARSAGCLAILSFVKPGGSEQRIVTKLGWASSDDDKGHRMFAKPLIGADSPKWTEPTAGGEIKCQ